MLNKSFLTSHDLLKEVPKQEFHIHTKYSDGQNTVKEFTKKAVKEGYVSICFTEHVDFTTNWFYEYQSDVKILNHFYQSLDVHYGVEVRAKDFKGNLNANKKILIDSEIVMGVVHRIPSEDGLNVYDPKKFSSEELLELEYDATRGLLKNGLVQIIGHPMSNYEKQFGETPEELYVDILELAKRKKVAIELNPMYTRNFDKFLELNLRVNTLISLGSNAHFLSDFGLSFNKVRGLLEE